jgi:hypothetical protein
MILKKILLILKNLHIANFFLFCYYQVYNLNLENSTVTFQIFIFVHLPMMNIALLINSTLQKVIKKSLI